MKIYRPHIKSLIIQAVLEKMAQNLDAEPPSPTEKQLRRIEKKIQREHEQRITDIKKFIARENRAAAKRERLESQNPMTLSRKIFT